MDCAFGPSSDGPSGSWRLPRSVQSGSSRFATTTQGCCRKLQRSKIWPRSYPARPSLQITPDLGHPSQEVWFEAREQRRVLGQLREGPEGLRLDPRDERRPAAPSRRWRTWLKCLPGRLRFCPARLCSCERPLRPHPRHHPSWPRLSATGKTVDLAGRFLGAHRFAPAREARLAGGIRPCSALCGHGTGRGAAMETTAFLTGYWPLAAPAVTLAQRELRNAACPFRGHRAWPSIHSDMTRSRFYSRVRSAGDCSFPGFPGTRPVDWRIRPPTSESPCSAASLGRLHRPFELPGRLRAKYRNSLTRLCGRSFRLAPHCVSAQRRDRPQQPDSGARWLSEATANSERRFSSL
jgi:hypothetical protein